METDEFVTEETEAETEQILMENEADSEILLPDTEIISEDMTELTEVLDENISAVSTDQTYTDEQGNIFIYVLDESGNATITGITLSGAALIIPGTVNDAPVVSVANGNTCVVSNPDVKIPELVINCHTIGIRAFYGVNIGTLTIGADVKELCVNNGIQYDFQFYYEQFAESTIDKVVFQAAELVVGHYTGNYADEFYGPFRGATIGELEIGSDVTLIPEKMFADSILEMDMLEIQAERVGAYAFSGENIIIHQLIIRENVKVFEEYSNSTELFHHWEQFSESTVGMVKLYAPALELEKAVGKGTSSSHTIYAPFMNATVSGLEIGTDVTYIPDYLLKDSIAAIEELELHMSSIGTMAFLGDNISIGKLTLGKEVQILQRSLKSSSTSQYWQQFAKATIGEVHYNVPSLQLDGEMEHDKSCYGPFWQSRIGKLYLSEEVERYPSYCFIDAYLEQDTLEIHAKSIGLRAFSSSNISIGTLTIGTEVETFENVTSGYFTSFGQFMGCTIGKLVYLLVHAETGSDCGDGVFEAAVIGALEIHNDVEVIPNYLFYQVVMELEELTLNVPVIGYYAFAGSAIKFQKLTVGESVTAFPANDSNYSRAFESNTIGMLYYNATEAKTEKLASSIYGAFASAKISGLSVGENVKLIPNGCFRNAYMDIEEVTLDNLAIGYAAFYSSNIKIGTLNIGKGVNYTGVVSNRLNTFQNATIGTLNYNSNSVEPEWSTSTTSYGMFSLSTIGQLNIGEDVETIPASWFRSAALAQDELTLSCGWSYDSFYSEKISIGTLTLTGDMAEITHVNNNNMAFAGNKINTVIYDIPSAVFTAPKSSAYGPFFNADITNFVLSERVEYIDYRLLRDNQIENCYVYAVNASESYKGQTLGAGYLPVCTNLHIHYNSAFKEFFSKEVTEYHWLCVDYFDTSYGEKFYDEETGTYSVEVFKTCSVCGYEENDVEELDSSYDVYFSIPIEIPLAFDSEKKAYAGSGEVYAYGTLGNAYEGIRLVVDKNAESYGKAAMGEHTYDISSYLSVGFGGNEETVFETSVLNDNTSCVTDGQMDSIVRSQMEVAVDGTAFLESGAGDYKISIPLRFELVK
uniref:leucine-rich repeat protein n=1 Tax=Agathobacter sp. TaxID=2021311 RepID=UPI0040560A67